MVLRLQMYSKGSIQTGVRFCLPVDDFYFNLLMIVYSFHKKGKRITASTTIKTSNATNNKVICQKPFCIMDEKATPAALFNNNSCGVMMGKPIIAIKAAPCCALAAMAAKNVKVNPKPVPPRQAIPKKDQP